MAGNLYKGVAFVNNLLFHEGNTLLSYVHLVPSISASIMVVPEGGEGVVHMTALAKAVGD